jgi:hypothetical protein
MEGREERRKGKREEGRKEGKKERKKKGVTYTKDWPPACGALLGGGGTLRRLDLVEVS